MPKSPNFRFFQGGLLKHRTTPKFLTTQTEYFSLLFLSALVGGITGSVVALFEESIRWITEQRLTFVHTLPYAEYIAPVAAVLAGAAMAAVGFWLTFKFAPEVAGSGIPHIEGALDGTHEIRWHRVLPIKFIAGTLTIGSGMVLGREGPSIQIGGAVGRMIASKGKRFSHTTHILTAAGAAAGLAAAFNAPLAGILFVVEEMRPQFRYSITSIKCVTLATAVATIVMRSLHGQAAFLDIPHFDVPPLRSLILFAVLGILFGVIGVNFNKWILKGTSRVKEYHQNKLSRLVLVGAMFGGTFAFLQLVVPKLSGSGMEIITEMFHSPMMWMVMVGFFVLRIIVTVACFASGAPGGIFAPMLTLGTLLGLSYGIVMAAWFPEWVSEPGVYAIAGMGALFAATVRAPVTGIILVVEMTNNYQLILPLLVTCLGATFIAQALGGQPLYSALLKQSLLEDKELRVDKNSPASN
ncbi:MULTISPECIES: H(+)/Cl(-) exchange transporter ClcA [Aliivibrio]|jgi:CIC family chloride channel protein|uniref:Chloride channel protein n=2 Tax=Aliivibrio logei TaxID=688 RepID=A0A1B9P207_ALILO|nr:MULTISPECIES: H(+)/Cl(-) exchange transporter ClcA [Aliivibrio]MBB1314860.1 H(+)/Cl(-) exchange transporter ClcA [Aliivibrio sp. SR45-2]OCH22390.1 chloride channel protein [Aliivibrio logei]OEF13599.1 chloride channel protein [Aliivibrio logei 5S-186]